MKSLLLIFGLLLIMVACNCDSKSDTWSEDQKTKWTASCLEFMESKEVEAGQAKEFCDCMLGKTSEKYSPEEAAKLTEAEERKLWESCDYQW